jgi:YD repeat-containing protein
VSRHQTHDLFCRPLATVAAKDAAHGMFIITPGPAYDANDNIVLLTAGNGAMTRLEYGPDDCLRALVAPPDRLDDPPRRTAYPPRGAADPPAEAPADAARADLRYDPDGLLAEVTDRDGLTRSLTRDARGLVREITASRRDGRSAGRSDLAYDPAGNLVAIVLTRPDGPPRTWRFDYDALKRVILIRCPETDGPARWLEYDEIGRVVATGLVTAPAKGSPGRTVLGRTADRRYAYLDSGWLLRVDDMTAGRSTVYDYNQVGQPTRRTVTTADGADCLIRSWEYFWDGKLRSITDETVKGGRTARCYEAQYDYDLRGRIASARATGTAAEVADAIRPRRS